MKQERKVSVLRNLLERVQKRADGPRIPAGAVPMAGASTAASVPVVMAAATPIAAAPPMAISAPPAQPTKAAGRPGSSTLPFDFASRGEASAFRPSPDQVPDRAASEVSRASQGATADRGPVSSPEDDAEQGPPSAPRLRDVPEEDVAADEHDIDDELTQIKTPPPESGRQDVTSGPTVTVSESEEDISITVTMEESEMPPPVSPLPSHVAPMPMHASGQPDIHEVSGPQPRLALVSEPEIELHGMTPLSAVTEPITPAKPPSALDPSMRSTANAPYRPQEIDLAVPVPSSVPAVPSATPSGVRPVPPPPAAAPVAPPAAQFARTSPSAPDTKPSVSAAPTESAGAPVRLMAQQPQGDPSGKPLPPVEVWASTFSPAALRGQVASFVGQNANFEPKTFGELVRASLALGEDKA